MVIGAIIGDIVGSRFEWKNIKRKDFELFTDKCMFTDDTVMTLALCDAFLSWNGNIDTLGNQAVKSMQALGRRYMNCGYGGSFRRWLQSSNPKPYNSWGNGAAMRVSSCGYVGRSITQVAMFSRIVTEVTHNHPEGLKGAEAIAVAVFLARTGKSMSYIERVIWEDYYQIDFKLDEIRNGYSFDVSCQGSVPQALEAFFESTSFEDAIRNAVSIGGDSDTIAAMTGSIAEAYYGVPEDIRNRAIKFLDDPLLEILKEFEKRYP